MHTDQGRSVRVQGAMVGRICLALNSRHGLRGLLFLPLAAASRYISLVTPQLGRIPQSVLYGRRIMVSLPRTLLEAIQDLALPCNRGVVGASALVLDSFLGPGRMAVDVSIPSQANGNRRAVCNDLGGRPSDLVSRSVGKQFAAHDRSRIWLLRRHGN